MVISLTDHLPLCPSLQEYVFRVDPGTSLGLSSDSIVCYRMGEVIRSHASEVPELLPCGYLVGDNIIKVNLKGRTSGCKNCSLFSCITLQPWKGMCSRKAACKSKYFLLMCWNWADSYNKVQKSLVCFFFCSNIFTPFTVKSKSLFPQTTLFSK